jgi:hypothetical protein
MLKFLALRFLTACVSCLAGLNLAVIAVPGPMGPTPFWDVIGEIFSHQYYSFDLMAVIAVMSSLLLLTDWIGPRRIHIAWLALIAAFCGGYYYTMGVWEYWAALETGMDRYLNSVMPQAAASVVGFVMFGVAWFLPFVLLAVVKLAGSSKFRQRFAIGSSKA